MTRWWSESWFHVTFILLCHYPFSWFQVSTPCWERQAHNFHSYRRKTNLLVQLDLVRCLQLFPTKCKVCLPQTQRAEILYHFNKSLMLTRYTWVPDLTEVWQSSIQMTSEVEALKQGWVIHEWQSMKWSGSVLRYFSQRPSGLLTDPGNKVLRLFSYTGRRCVTFKWEYKPTLFE